MPRGAAAAIPYVADPVLAAFERAPVDDMPESDEERRAVQVAKASRRMRLHAVVEAAIESLRQGE